MATQLSKPPQLLGGQHAAPVGTSTLHHVCPADFCAALQREGKQFDPHEAPDSEPQPDRDWLAFEAERAAAANENDTRF